MLLVGYFRIQFRRGMYGIDGIINVGFETIPDVCLLKIIILPPLFDFKGGTIKNFELHYQRLAQQLKPLPCRYDTPRVCVDFQ